MAMRNVKVNVKGNILTITVDMKAEAVLSKSQLTRVIASTGGLSAILPGVKLNLNVTQDRDDLSEEDRAGLRTASKATRAGK